MAKIIEFNGCLCSLEDTAISDEDNFPLILDLTSRLGYTKFYDWQLHFLNSFINSYYYEQDDIVHKFSLLGVHGTGKSTIVAIATAMLMLIVDEKNEQLTGTVIAITEKQADSAFWKKIRQIADRNRNLFVIDRNSFYLKHNPFICVNKRAYAKQHTHSLAGEHALNVINIIDEASGADQNAIDILKTHYTSEWGKLKGFFMLMGNPPRVQTGNEFYMIHNREYSGYNIYEIARQAVVDDLSRDSYTLNVIKEITDVHGKDYDYKEHENYKRLVLGKLPSEGAGHVFPDYVTHKARTRTGLRLPPFFMSLDFAGGDDPKDNKNHEKNDESALLIYTPTAFIEGFTVKIRIPDFMNMVYRYIEQYQVKVVFGDGLGLGLGAMQMLEDCYFNNMPEKPDIVIIKGSEKAVNYHRFYNRRTENYWLLREWLEGRYDMYGHHAGGGLAYLGEERIKLLINELRQIKFVMHNGLIKLEPKETLSKSPDFADVCANAMTYQFYHYHKHDEIYTDPKYSDITGFAKNY